MIGHEIVWEHERDSVTARIVCNEDPGADCRLASAGPDCDCEAWGRIERREDGTIWHELTEGYRDLTKPRWVTQWHEVKPSDECNVVNFMSEDPSLIAECSQERKSFEIGRTPIEPVWLGDFYEWKRAEVTP